MKINSIFESLFSKVGHESRGDFKKFKLTEDLAWSNAIIQKFRQDFPGVGLFSIHPSIDGAVLLWEFIIPEIKSNWIPNAINATFDIHPDKIIYAAKGKSITSLNMDVDGYQAFMSVFKDEIDAEIKKSREKLAQQVIES